MRILIESWIGKVVSVYFKHTTNPKLYFCEGIIEKVTDNAFLIKHNHGTTLIPFHNISSIVCKFS